MMNVEHIIRGRNMDKITVQRANVILDISPDQKDYYLGQGYSVIDDRGNVVEQTHANTVEALQSRIAALEKELKKKDAEIAKLQSQPTPEQKKSPRSKKSE